MNAGSMAAAAAAVESGDMGVLAMKHKDYQQALFYLNLGIQQAPLTMPMIAAKLLKHRADCFWEMEKKRDACQDMRNAIDLNVHTQIPGCEREAEAMKWIKRGEERSGNEEYQTAVHCFTFGLKLCGRQHDLKAWLFAERAAANFMIDKTGQARRDIKSCRKLDSYDIVKTYCHRWKGLAIEAFIAENYKKAIKLFCLANELSSKSMTDLRYQIHSYLATCHFKLEDYKKALKSGQDCFDVKPAKSQVEARRWKERGKQLFKEQQFSLLVDCYTLAIAYTPFDEKDLYSQLLCNRSLVYIKLKAFSKALEDASKCVKLRPMWSKAHYRLGSSLTSQFQHREAMRSFATAMELAESDEEMFDTLMQIITVGLCLKEGTIRITSAIPQPIIQRAVTEVVKKREWKKLQLLFLGSNSEELFDEGLAFGCDASNVPLEEVAGAPLRNRVELIEALINNDAKVDGSPGCKSSPLVVAMEMEDFKTVTLLHECGADVSSLLSAEHLKSKNRAVYWQKQGVEAFETGLHDEAIRWFMLSMHFIPESDAYGDLPCKNFGFLSEIFFKQKKYKDCVDAGKKMRGLRPAGSESEAKKWKDRGNQLFKAKEFEVVTQFYAMAIAHCPTLGSEELMSVLLSNRSLALSQLGKQDEALDDAQRCISVRPEWFKGYYRKATCLNGLGRHKEALKVFCDAFKRTENKEDQMTMVSQIISTALHVEDGTTSVSCRIPSDILQRVIQSAVNKGELNKIHMLFLGGYAQRSFAKGRGGLATGCNASQIPVDLVMQAPVLERSKLVELLLDHGASANGLPGCKKQPLSLAMENDDYALAMNLIKYKADTSCLFSSTGVSSSHRENQAQYWKDCGIAAMESDDHKKAVKLLNLSLQFSSSSLSSSSSSSFLHQVHSHLASAYFKLKEYSQAVHSGNQCFNSKPVKSQAEATKWKNRGKQLFKEKRFVLLIEYYTLAIKYVPSNDREFLATLLCNRALAYYNTHQYQHSLEDAKSCSKFRSDWFKGYVRQGYCYADLKQNREAVRAFSEALKRSDNEEDGYVILSQMLSLAYTLSEGLSSVTCSVSYNILTRLIKEVTLKREWEKLYLLFLGGGGQRQFIKGEGGVATGCDASEIPLELVMLSGTEIRSQLVPILLDSGASPNGLGKGRRSPLALAVDKEEYVVAAALLQHKADVSCLTLKEGDTVYHHALKQAFAKGSFTFIKALLDPEFCENPDVTDANGNTLFHLVTIGKCSRRKCDAIQILSDFGVNPLLRNKDGKQPIDILAKKDPRLKMVRIAAQAYQTGLKQRKSKRKRLERVPVVLDKRASVEREPQDVTQTGPATEQKRDFQEQQWNSTRTTTRVPPEIRTRKDPLDEVKESIQDAIERVGQEKDEAVKKSSRLEDDEGCQNVQESEEVEGLKGVNDEQQEEVILEDDGEEEEETDGIVLRSDEEIDWDSPFEDLQWEVDCTDQFWKTLRSKAVSDAMKRKIVAKIRMLAEGRWSRKLCRRLESPAKKYMLFEAKLTRSARIIWELTVAFSARCSKDPEIRVSMSQPCGRVYSEIIRVWDVAANHAALVHKLECILKAQDRGQNCLIRRELQGLRRNETDQNNLSGERVPKVYVEVTNDFENSLVNDCKSGQQHNQQLSKKFFFPPASANDQEYHILKFYSFSSALVNSILHTNPNLKVDFPFRVTELEHAIINLRPNPPSAVILLGRSGTGKTTCCLYRLWNEFESYWQKAITAGPHMPKLVQFLPKKNGISIDEPVEEENREKVDVRELNGNQREMDDISLNSDFVHAKEARRQEQEGGDDSCGFTVREDFSAEEAEYEHLHQVFVTKNAVLCSEVQKNFSELSNACPAATEHSEVAGNPLPSCLQDVDEAAWPLFISSRDWLLILDASLPGKKFFPRADNGSLLKKIAGWGTEETHLAAIEEDSDSDVDDLEADEYEAAQDTDNVVAKGEKQLFDPRREVSYDVFANELWPRIAKKEKVHFHPTLVWTEIRSFIKGSVEALHTAKGFLSLEEYVDLGRKRAPNFSADRRQVYAMFQNYHHIKSSRGMFDEADVVFSLFLRLGNAVAPEWSVHRFYVDETQDFTQSELSLLIRCCRDPNGLFFTGDTAQSIMRGVAFRFSDLKSLFYYARQAYHTVGIQAAIQVPNRLYQLTHNYRSHAGILRLASSVVDMLLHFFPDSFDKLEKDQGLFEGPKPVLLESCSFGDLAMILRGNRRQSSRIEFGAHQCILVVSDEARDQMPDELKHGLVLTIYEAKGLEFDDVLIYNFFKDSQARKEWRVVTSYVKALQEGRVPSTSSLVELTEDDLEMTSRPLEFDPEKHKVLNSELKFLYTAITRARVNVWFFDQDLEIRAPVFEYFQKLGLVRVVSLAGSGDEPLANMFVETSSGEEWREQGQYFYNKHLWEVAAKCFSIAGDEKMQKRSQAQLLAAEAAKLRGNPRAMRAEFLKAANQFLLCNMVEEAAVCLHNAKEKLLLGRLQQQCGKFEEAAKIFRREQKYQQASECFEMVNDYCQAVEVLCQGSLYEEAIDVMERYNSLAGAQADRTRIRPPKAMRTVERLCHQLAEEHFRSGRLDEMVAVLQRLPCADDQIAFLENHGCIDQAAEAMVREGRFAEAANLMKENGRFIEATKYSGNLHFVAKCFVSAARTLRHTDTEEFAELIDGPLERAGELFEECRDTNGEAEVSLMFAMMYRDSELADYSQSIFSEARNTCGEIESYSLLFQLRNLWNDIPMPSFLKALQKLLNLVIALHKPNSTNAEQRDIDKCEEYFGLSSGRDTQTRSAFVRSGDRFVSILRERCPQLVQGNKVTVSVAEAHRHISHHLGEEAIKLVRASKEALRSAVNLNSLCRKLEIGVPCVSPEKCKFRHESCTKEHFDQVFQAVFFLIHLNALLAKFAHSYSNYDTKDGLSQKLLGHDVHDFQACRRLYSVIFPKAGQQAVFLSKEQVSALRKHGMVRERLATYAVTFWRKQQSEERLCNADAFVKVSRIMQLVGLSSKTAVWLSLEEKEFNKKASLDKKLVSDGMLNDKNSGYFRSYFRLFEDGKHFLTTYGNVLNSTHFTIRRFLSLPACRVTMSVPRISNTVSLLEHQLIACLALFTRLFGDYDYPILLPASYLSLVDFWNVVNCSEKKHYGLFEAVEHTANSLPPYKALRQVQSLLEYLVKLMCGGVSQHFNVIFDAFKSPECLASGETERVLVLALTMLCNCGKGIPTVCQGYLLNNLRNVSAERFYSARIREVVETVHHSTGLQDIVVALQTLLRHRNELIHNLRWQSKSLSYNEPVRAEAFAPAFSEETPEPQPPPQEAVYADGTSELAMPAGYLEAQIREQARAELEAEQELAAIKIQRWFRSVSRARCKSHADIGEDLPKEDVKHVIDPVVAHFDKFKVDRSECSVCGMRFRLQDSSQQVKGSSEETYEQHLSETSAHWQKVDELTRYRSVYMESLHPLLAEENIIRAQLKASEQQAEANGTLARSHDLGLDLQRLDHVLSRLGRLTRDIEARCAWNEAEQLQTEIATFRKTLLLVQSIVSQEAVRSAAEREGGQVDAAAEEDDFQHEDEIMEVSGKKGERKGRGKRRQGRGRRKKPKKDERQA